MRHREHHQSEPPKRRGISTPWPARAVVRAAAGLAAIFDSVTASAEGVDRLEPCEERRPYILAAIPKPVAVLRAPTERKTGVKHAEVVTRRLVQDTRGWLRITG